MMTNEYLNSIKTKLSEIDFKKLTKIANSQVHQFIAESIKLCNPQKVFICSDTVDETVYIKHKAIAEGEESSALVVPGHTFHFDGPQDQGRDREVTRFLVPKTEVMSPALKQIERDKGLEEIFSFLKDSMKGRIMVVRFLALGPLDSIFTIPCMECTDSWYVAHSVDLLYRKGYDTFCKISKDAEFFKTLHSVGRLSEDKVSIDYDKKRIYIDYLTNTVYSVNTQYAGNSIGFKKLALRLAIRKAHREGWLAEHFMIIGVGGPKGRKTYFAGAFPSACGKTSTAMLPRETIFADDLAYVRNIEGDCRAVNVESGIFGIIQDVNPKDEPQIYEVLTSPGEIIFSNVLIKDAQPYWLGMGSKFPKEGISYSGRWYEGKIDQAGEKVLPSHKNARYAVALKALKNCDSELDNPLGVKLGGIMFGGRDYNGYVPIQQGFNWEHGIITYGAALETETTFATVEEEGKYEINVMSIQDFISISLGRYIKNYLEFGWRLKDVPSVFGVNYFLCDLKTGEFLNSRKDKHIWVKWMELRAHNDVKARKTPTGFIPLYEDLVVFFKQLMNKEYTKEEYNQQFTIRIPQLLAKVERIREFWKTKVSDAPEELFSILDEQKSRLLKAKECLGDYILPASFEMV